MQGNRRFSSAPVASRIFAGAEQQKMKLEA
jgi:hypothetical protein